MRPPLSPQPLHAAWSVTAAKFEEAKSNFEPLLPALQKAYSQGSRHYHTLTHVLDCLQILDSYPKPLPHQIEIELALWYHDAIYDPQRQDNESKSADLLQRECTQAKLPQILIKKANDLVIATDHRRPAQDEAEAIIADVDMAILAASPKRYQSYIEAIREEYSSFNDTEYNSGRTRFLIHFLEKAEIFQTPFFRGCFEEKARTNMSSELSLLKSSL